MSLFRQKIFSQRKKGKKESESHSDQGGNFAELKLALSAGRTGSLSAFERGPVSCSSARNSTRVATFAPFFALFYLGIFMLILLISNSQLSLKVSSMIDIVYSKTVSSNREQKDERSVARMPGRT
jgi:hypothetical protein